MYDENCLSCRIVSGKTELVPIIKTKLFNVAQDYEIPIPGFMIIATTRHISSFMDFTNEEKVEFMDILQILRKAMKDTLGIDDVYYFQEEKPGKGHFHFRVFPRYDWMSEMFGNYIESVRPIMNYARVELKGKNDKEVKEAEDKLRNYVKGKIK